jgi:hypothetical protein
VHNQRSGVTPGQPDRPPPPEPARPRPDRQLPARPASREDPSQPMPTAISFRPRAPITMSHPAAPYRPSAGSREFSGCGVLPNLFGRTPRSFESSQGTGCRPACTTTTCWPPSASTSTRCAAAPSTSRRLERIGPDPPPRPGRPRPPVGRPAPLALISLKRPEAYACLCAAVHSADIADNRYRGGLHLHSRTESRAAGRQELLVFNIPAPAPRLGTGRIPAADTAHAVRHE